METAADVIIPGAPAPAPEVKDPLAGHKAEFSKLLKKQASEDAGEPQKPAEKAPEKPAAKAPPKPKVAAAVAAPSVPKKDVEVEKLRGKLRLAGHPQKAIESLSDPEVREWWTLQEAREKDAAEVRERAAALEREAKSKATVNPEHGVPTGPTDLEDIADELAAQFGEDESGTILKALQRLVAPMAAEVSQLKGVIHAAQEKGKRDITSANRARLAERLPQLKENDRAWQILEAQVVQSFKDNPSQYASAEEAFDDFAQAIYGDFTQVPAESAPAEEADDAGDLAARIAASTPTQPVSKKSTKKVTPVDAAYAGFRALLKDPEDIEGCRRAYNRATLPQ